MNVLITSAACALAQRLAASLSSKHQIRLTDLIDVQTDFEFVRCELGHEEETNRLVHGMDAIIHVAQLPPSLLAESTDADNLTIDFQTRCTYNLLWAAADEKVKRAIYASTLHLFDQHDENWTVTESWRPRPTTEISTLSRHLGEFVCREFAREDRLDITCLRLGELISAVDAQTESFNSMWLEMDDAIRAFECALDAHSRRWTILHIQSEFPNSRFSIRRAKEALKFNPQFTVTR